MESGSENSDVLFPSVEEIKSYFPEDVWNTMAEYERSSYRNILHNYNVMKSIDLNPKKPSFMKSCQTKGSKRKAVGSPCPTSTKKPLLSRGKPLKVVGKRTLSVKNRKSSEVMKEQQKTDPVMFDSSHRWRSIKLHCVFAAVFKVYKRYHGIIKGRYLNKNKSPKITKNHSKSNFEMNMEKTKNEVMVGDNHDGKAHISPTNKECNDGKSRQIDGTSNALDKSERSCNKPEPYEDEEQPSEKSSIVLAAQDNSLRKMEESNNSADVKKSGCVTHVNKSAVLAPKPKPVCRSVQTMTVHVGCSPSSSALVFVNAGSAKRLSSPFPDPSPLTPQQQRRMKKINQEKMKNCRNVQTQTAAENSSIEKTKLVFFPVSKPKKPKSQLASSAQTDSGKKEKSKNVKKDSGKKEELNNGNQLDVFSAENSDNNQTIVRTSLPESDNGIKVVPTPNGNTGTSKETPTDASSDDEFGFSALAELENETKTKTDLTAKPTIPETKIQPVDTDLAVRGCSGHLSDNRFTQKPASNKSTESSDEDEFGFVQLEKDEKAKRDLAAKLTNSETEAKPNDSDLAVPSCSGELSGRRYPRRGVPVINYTEAELLQDDEYLFCDLCDREYEGDCPEHGPHKFFPDKFVPVTGDAKRAIQTTPAMLKVHNSKIPGAGSGVWTMLGLPPHVRFGPYEGDKTSEPDPLGYSWAIVKDKRLDHYVAAQSTATSNWMRFVNCARHETEQNLMAFQYKGRMYYRTVKLIPPKAELFVWYGKEYAERLGISMEGFRSKDTSHLRDLVFTCDKCNVTYTSPLYLEAHEKYCRGKRTVKIVEPSRVPSDVQTLAVVVDGRKTYCCNLCDYKTVRSGSIKDHMVTHSGERPYKCDVCSKGFTHTGHLGRHKRIHSGEKPFKCNQCPYSSNRSHHLKLHMTRHTGEQMFACTDCGYKTSQISHLKNHLYKHSGVMPYRCTLCSFATAYSGDLTKHMRIHTGEKPYSCQHCQYKSAQKGALNKHISRHHSDQM